MIVIGTGAQAKYAINIATLLGIQIDKIFEPYEKKWKKELFLDRYQVEVYDINKIPEYAHVVCCFSNSFDKEYFFKELKQKNCYFINLIHPQSCVGIACSIGMGCIINPNVVIQPNSRIGNFCMIHSGVIIEHDCVIGNFSNLAPSVTLAGGVSVGQHTTINTGTIVAPNVKIGDGCIIGAGSLVMKSIPDNKVAFGHPINILKEVFPVGDSI